MSNEFVIDSAFQYGDEVEAVGLPNVRLVRDAEEFFGNGNGWSEVLENPTPNEILEAVNRSVIATQDLHHVFFEGVEKVDSPDEIPTFELSMGS
jgi:hypothetical protein